MSYRSENNPVALILRNIDLNTVSIAEITTIPPDVSFLILNVIVISNSFTAGSSSTVSIGTASGSYVDIVSPSVLNSFTASNQSIGLNPINLISPISSGTSIFVQVTPAGLPPGPFSAQIALLGYYF